MLTPVEEYSNILFKREDLYKPYDNFIGGSKIRQCRDLVEKNLDYIKEECNSTISTAASINSSVSPIVSRVAKEFKLKSIIGFGNTTIEKALKHKPMRMCKELDSEFVIIAPDEGALKRVQTYANKFKMPFMVVSKERDYTQINKVEKAVLIGDKKYLEDRTAIIIDDMADTCGTVIKVGDVLMSKGAKDIIIIVTHGILSGPAIERINNTEYIKEVVVSDTLPQNHNQKRCNKLKTFSIAPMLSEVITRLDKGGSLSEIFNN